MLIIGSEMVDDPLFCDLLLVEVRVFSRKLNCFDKIDFEELLEVGRVIEDCFLLVGGFLYFEFWRLGDELGNRSWDVCWSWRRWRRNSK